MQLWDTQSCDNSIYYSDIPDAITGANANHGFTVIDNAPLIVAVVLLTKW